MKHSPLIGIVAMLAFALAGCGGGGTGPIIGPNANDGYFRFVNGSADSGSVDVYVDGTKLNSSAGTYGYVSAYNGFKAGQHTVVVDVSGTQTAVAGIPQAALTQSINGGQYVSLVLTGEQHPKVATDTINLLAYTDQPFSTPSGGFAVNIHNAATVTGSSTTAFTLSSGGGSQALGTIAAGGVTGPVGITSNFINPNTTVTITGTPSATGIAAASMTPSDIDSSGCAANTLPCNSGSLALYFIDGPAASLVPDAAPYPAGISATSSVGFVGLFDANGT